MMMMMMMMMMMIYNKKSTVTHLYLLMIRILDNRSYIAVIAGPQSWSTSSVFSIFTGDSQGLQTQRNCSLQRSNLKISTNKATCWVRKGHRVIQLLSQGVVSCCFKKSPSGEEFMMFCLVQAENGILAEKHEQKRICGWKILIKLLYNSKSIHDSFWEKTLRNPHEDFSACEFPRAQIAPFPGLCDQTLLGRQK